MGNVTNIFLKKKKVVCFAATHGVRSVGSPSLSVSMHIILAFGRPVTSTAGLTAGQTATGTLSVLKKNFLHVHDTSDSPAAGSPLFKQTTLDMATPLMGTALLSSSVQLMTNGRSSSIGTVGPK